MAKKRVYDDDDGRTIADMSGVPSAKASWFPAGKKASQSREQPDMGAPSTEGKRPWEAAKGEMSKEDRRVYILAALRAALLIAAVFICGLGLATWLLLRLWS